MFVFLQIVCAALSVACTILESGICPLRSRVAAMLAACFYVPGLLFKGMNKDGCKKRKISSSFLPGQDLPQASCLIRVEGHSALACAKLEEGQESFNNDFPWDDVSDAVVTESPEYQCAAAAFEGTSRSVHSGPGKRNTRSSLSSFSSKGRSAAADREGELSYIRLSL